MAQQLPITAEMASATRKLVVGFDWSTRRIERFHRVIAGFAIECHEKGVDSARVYDFVRTIGSEVGETVNGALFMVEAARQTPRS